MNRMKRNRNLLLFTKNFPFGTGESFIENEIETAGEFYEHIYIIACQVHDKSRIREIPDNVTVFCITERLKAMLLVDTIRNALKRTKDNDFSLEWDNCHSIMKKMFISYFYSKVEWFEKNCTEQICQIMKRDVDYVFYSYWFFDTAFLASRLKNSFSKEYNIDFVTRAHGYDLYEYRNRFKYFPFRTMILKSIDKVYPCSKDGEKYLINKYPDFAEKFEKSYLGTMDCGEKKINYDRGEIAIVTCSNLIPIKRVDRLPEALQLLENRGYKIRWTCFGDGSERKKIKKKCDEYLRTTSVVFKGNIPNKLVLDFYKNEDVDVFVNLSSTEGLPVSIMEAMSFGIPAVATNVGGTSEVVVNGMTGVILNKDFTKEELANAILEITDCVSENKKSMRESCRSFWEQNFCSSNNFKCFYEKLLKIGEEKNGLSY